MIEAIKKLPGQPLPSASGSKTLLNGLEGINHRIADVLQKH
jgi:hypothetical protein